MAHQNNYTLGGGKLFFNRFKPKTKEPTDYRYFGCSQAISLNFETEQLDHHSTENGMRVKDESVTIAVNGTSTLTIDDLSPENLAFFFLGEAGTRVVAAATALTFDLEVNPDRYYKIGQSDTNVTGLRNLENVTVVQGGGGATPIVADGNYEINEELGTLHILDNPVDVYLQSPNAKIKVTCDVKDHVVDTVISKGTPVEGSLMFEANNPVGKNLDFYLPYVKISPNGDLNLKAEEWQQLQFNVEILKRDDKTELAYIDGRPV